MFAAVSRLQVKEPERSAAACVTFDLDEHRSHHHSSCFVRTLNSGQGVLLFSVCPHLLLANQQRGQWRSTFRPLSQITRNVTKRTLSDPSSSGLTDPSQSPRRALAEPPQSPRRALADSLRSPLRALAESSRSPPRALAEPSQNPCGALAEPSRSPSRDLAEPSQSPRRVLTESLRSPRRVLPEPSLSPPRALAEPSLSCLDVRVDMFTRGERKQRPCLFFHNSRAQYYTTAIKTTAMLNKFNNSTPSFFSCPSCCYVET